MLPTKLSSKYLSRFFLQLHTLVALNYNQNWLTNRRLNLIRMLTIYWLIKGQAHVKDLLIYYKDALSHFFLPSSPRTHCHAARSIRSGNKLP